MDELKSKRTINERIRAREEPQPWERSLLSDVSHEPDPVINYLQGYAEALKIAFGFKSPEKRNITAMSLWEETTKMTKLCTIFLSLRNMPAEHFHRENGLTYKTNW